MRRYGLIAFVLFAAVALVAVLQDDVAPRFEHAGQEEPPPADAPPPTLTTHPAPPQPSTPERRRQRSPRAAEKIPTAQTLGQVTIQGRVVIVDEGVERVPETGTIRLIFWRGRRGTHQEVDVRAGKFEFVLRPASKTGVRSMTLEGATAVEADVSSGARHDVMPDEVFRLRARLVKSTTLRVVSADTGLELEGVDVVVARGLRSAGHHHPGAYGEKQRAIRMARSPVELPLPTRSDAETGFQRLYVRTQGHAWQQVRIDPARGGQQTVKLPVGASLRVRLASLGVWANRYVKVASDVSDRISIINLRIGEAHELLIESLPVGERRVWVSEGASSFPEPPVIVSTSVTLRAAETVEVVFEAPARDRQPLAPLRGTLEFAKAWGRQSNLAFWVARVDLERHTQEKERKVRLQRTSAGGAERQTFEWNAGEVLSGTYKLHLARLPWATLIEVPEAGASADVRVPDPVDVTLRLRSEDGSALPASSYLHWQPVGPATRLGGSLHRAEPGGELGSFRLRAAAGAIRVSTPGQTISIPDGEIAVPRSGEYEVVARRQSGFSIVLKDGDRTVPWSASWFDFDASRNAGFESSGWAHSDAGMTIYVAKPGRYRFHLKPIPGYVRPGVQTVDVEEGRYVEVVVLLQREAR